MTSNTLYQTLLWAAPLLMLAIGFITSKITRFRLARYGIYTLILFIAFLFDLQSKSFLNDKFDLLFSQFFVWVFSDFFWRVFRRKNRILHFAGLGIGLLLFIWNYYEWLLIGPAYLNSVWNTEIRTEKHEKRSLYFVKERRPAGLGETTTRNLILYKKVVPQFLEQKIDQFEIPEGYETAILSFAWQRVEELVTVQVIGDHDTLWTLTEKFPQ